MPKKKSRKSPSKKKVSLFKLNFTNIIILAALLLVFGIIAKSIISPEKYKVLGASTLIARGGDDSGSDDSGGDSNSGSGSSSESNSGSSDSSDDSGSSSSGSSGSSSSGSDTSTSGGSTGTGSVLEDTRVLCTGPDGRQFETKFEDCQELNQAWGTQLNFTVLQSQQKKNSSDDLQDLEISGVPENEVEDENEIESEINDELSESERIRIRTKDGRTRIDITSGGIKTRLEIRDDRVIIKAEQEDGTEVELEDDTLLKIVDRLSKDDIKIATAGAGRFLLQKGLTGAITDFPISVDLATNSVFINTPAGQKTLTVLPEQAIKNLIAANVLSRLGANAATVSGNLTVSQIIALGEQNGIPIYQINGVSEQRLLGIIPVEIEKNIIVSAVTGNALSIEESLGARILDAISF